MPQDKLEIVGFRGNAVPNEFIPAGGRSNRLALLVPGFGYTCDMPLFYYLENLLSDSNVDVLRLNTRYNERPSFMQRLDEQGPQLLEEDTFAAIEAGLAQHQYEELLLIGKSLGTLSLANILTSRQSPVTPMKLVWLTPMLKHEDQLAKIAGIKSPGIIVIGTADPHYDTNQISDLDRDTPLEFCVIAGGDHSLDIPGDTQASIAALETAIEAIASFLNLN